MYANDTKVEHTYSQGGATVGDKGSGCRAHTSALARLSCMYCKLRPVLTNDPLAKALSTTVSETGHFVAETGDFVAVSGDFVARNGDIVSGNMRFCCRFGRL